MANNYQEIYTKILERALSVFSGSCVMPLLVSRNYDSTTAREAGDVINYSSDVMAGALTQQQGDRSLANANVELKIFQTAGFKLHHSEKLAAMNGHIPTSIKHYAYALAEDVNQKILEQYKNFYTVSGQAGVTPFSNRKTTDINQASKQLNENKAPSDNRWVVLNREAAFAAQMALQNDSDNGFSSTNKSNQFKDWLGMEWYMHRGETRHETSASLNDWIVNGTPTVGSTTIGIQSGTSAPAHGDIFSIDGDNQTYVVKSFNKNNKNNLAIAPPLRKQPASGALLTFLPDHGVNLVFHRDAIGWASASFQEEYVDLGPKILTQNDPKTNIQLRLEIFRQCRQTLHVLYLLGGVATIHPSWGCRLLG